MNPEEIQDVPLIVLSDLTSGIVEFFIKMRTRGDYNHIMWLNRPGFFASQGNTYSEVSLSRYMKKNSRLKFFEVIGLTPVQKRLIQESIEKKLAKPFWGKWYDWLGIAGQASGLQWLNVPGLEYCSEDVPQHLKYMASKAMSEGTRIHEVIMGIPAHASPQGLNDYFNNHPEVFGVYGKWEYDDQKENVGLDKIGPSPVPA